MIGRALALTGALAAAAAAAQDAPRSALPGRRFEPPPLAPPAPPPRVVTPAAPPVTAPVAAASGPRFVLRGVRLAYDGPEIVPDVLGAGAVPLIGQRVGFAELDALRRSLTEALVAEGFVNSGVLLPDQQIENGVVTFRVVVGRLTAVRIAGDGLATDGPAGLGRLDPDYVTALLDVSPDAAFDLDALRETLRRLLRDRNIARIDAAVRPGDALGQAELDVAVETRRPVDFAFSLDNATRADLGELTVGFFGAARNLIGVGDEIRADARLSRGAREVVVEADAPLRPGGVSAIISAELADADIVEAPLDALEIDSRFERLGVGLSAPLIDTASREARADLRFDVKRTRSRLLGSDFSFSPGVRDGRSALSVIEAAATWLERAPDATLALRSALRAGLPVLGATENDDGAPDGRFIAWIGQVQAAVRLDEAVTILARGQTQLASTRLLPAEKIAIGGADTVRGYREGALIGDQAFAGTLEARVSLIDLPVRTLTPPGHDATLTIAPFVDVGAAWDKGAFADRRTALGVGAGLSWSPSPAVTASIAVGFALRDAPEAGDEGGLQEEGVHFALSVRLP